MKTQKFSKTLIKSFLLSLCMVSAAEAGAPADKPNIIYIMADDLGWGHVGYQGQKQIPTPSIDRLATEGMQFSQAYAGSTVCAPSRSVLMTGLHTGHTPIRGNWDSDGNRVPITADTVTVAEVLKEAGYTTGMVGKWGLGEPGTEGEPNDQGFDHWYGFLNQRNAHEFYPDYVWRNKTKVEFPENADHKRNTYIHNLMTDEALNFIEDNQDKPFFLYLPYTLPHTELAAPEEEVAPFRGKFEYKEVPMLQGRPVVKDALAVYAGMVATLDRDIGKIMAKLEALGLDDNTLVIFTSDNGPATEAGMKSEYFDGSGPLRGIKRDLYEGGIRVPMIAKWPGKIAAGSSSDALTAMWDVMPTLAEIGGTQAPSGIDGISIVPTLLGKAQDTSQRMLYWEFQFTKGTFRQAVRIGNMKAVRVTMDQPIEVYDLAADLGETRNLAKDHPAFVARAAALFKSERVPSIYDDK